MASESPYIGSKISLISKAKIRYEGILYTIDTENATVALSKVRSFGTEERTCERPVAPRDEVYEYIIFRGTDIEDLTVCEPPKPAVPQPLPQDPAIVQSVVTSQPSVPPNLPPFSGNNPYNQMPPNYAAYMQQPRMPYSSLTTGQSSLSVDNKSPLPAMPSEKAASPVSMGRTSPTSDQGVQTTSPAVTQDHSSQSRRTYESNSYYNSRRNNSFDEQQPSNYYNAEGEGVRGRGGNRRGYHYRHRDDDYENRGRGQRRNYYRGNNEHQSQNYRGGQKYSKNRRYNSRNDPLRFDGDFDFETSNAQFNKEDIAKELMSKLKITGAVAAPSKEETKTVGEEKQDSGIDSGTSHETAEESDEAEEQACYYDKTKSFFDNITCETNHPRGERMSWTEERKRNTETFGHVWRGRGGYRGRSGGYRGQGQYRGRGRGGYQQQRDDGERRNYYNNRYHNYNYDRNSNDGGQYRGRAHYYRGGSGGYNRSGGQTRGRQWVDYEYRNDRRPRKQDGEKVNS